MPNLCCLPGCSNRNPKHHLFRVPSKKFCAPGSDKHSWAENLEKIIKGYRGDSYINVLFKKDRVRICDAHFKETDFLKAKSKLHLKRGAMPTLNLPKKSIEIPRKCRKPPKERVIKPKYYASKISNIQQQISSHIKSGWRKQSDEPLMLEYRIEPIHQPLYSVKITDDLECFIHYHGWAVPTTISNQFDLKLNTLNQVLGEIQNLYACPGVSHDDMELHKHIVTEPGSLSSYVVPKITLLATRVLTCEVLCQEEGPCKNCLQANKMNLKKLKGRENYKEMVRNKPLKKLSSNSLQERMFATLESNKTTIAFLRKRVDYLLQREKELMATQESLTTLLAQQNQDVKESSDPLWDEQVKLRKADKNGTRFGPETIQLCLKLISKSSTCYEELRSSGILRLPSLRTLLEHRKKLAAQAEQEDEQGVSEDISRITVLVEEDEEMVVSIEENALEVDPT